MENNKIERVPIHLKLALTSKEAAEYSNIGITRSTVCSVRPSVPSSCCVGTKKLVKRKEFEQYISSKLVI